MGQISVANPAEKQSSTVIPAHTAGGLLLQVVRYAIAIAALIGAGIAVVLWWVARDISTENAYVVGNVYTVHIMNV